MSTPHLYGKLPSLPDEGSANEDVKHEGISLLSSQEADRVRNRRRSCFCRLFFLLALVVAGAVAAGVVVQLVSNSSKREDKLQFADVFNANFTPRTFSAGWMPTSDRLFRKREASDGAVELEVYKADSDSPGYGELFCRLPAELWSMSVSTVKMSPDEEYVLLAVNQTGLYRHSRISQYAVVFLNSSTSGLCSFIGWLHNGAKLRVAVWSPAATVASLVYVTSGVTDIYFVDDVHDLSASAQVTHDGVDGQLFNGVPDWLYEEEILSSAEALWWSKDGAHFAYGVFNESGVKSFSWVHFGDPTDAYVDVRSIRYPKAGTTNPTVLLKLCSVASPQLVVNLKVPDTLSSVEHYLMQVRWLNNTHVSALWMDRLQQRAVLAVYGVAGGESLATLTWQSDTWIENYPYTSTRNGRDLLLRLPISRPGHYVHLARVAVVLGDIGIESAEFLTSGPWEVTGIASVQPAFVIVTATVEGPETRHLFWVALSAKEEDKPPCLTCYRGEDSCKYNSFSMSPSGNHTLWQCRGPDVPRTQLAKLLYVGGFFNVSYVFEDNSVLRESVSSFQLPKKEFFRVIVENVSMPAFRIVPPGDTDSRWPTLFHAYNGPLSQQVTADYLLSSTGARWHAYLASEYKIQVVTVDGRGTAYMGEDYGKVQYRRLGVIETKDQVAAGQYAAKHLNADADNLAFWGWSYGGFMASMIASSETDVFSTCMAVAPVTDWRYYDTAYTERYMRLPTSSDNLNNYDNTSVLNRAAHFGKTKYLVVHGTDDDNVHFQNTAQLVKVLTENLVDFQVQFYTDKTHSLGGRSTQQHLYRLLSDFLRTSLGV